jgi:hypothetical protein
VVSLQSLLVRVVAGQPLVAVVGHMGIAGIAAAGCNYRHTEDILVVLHIAAVGNQCSAVGSHHTGFDSDCNCLRTAEIAVGHIVGIAGIVVEMIERPVGSERHRAGK